MPELPFSKVQNFILLVDGTFTTRQIWAELNIITPSAKGRLREYLRRLADSGVIAKTNTDGTFRKLDTEKKEMEWQKADTANVLNVKWPFELEKYALVYPKNVVIIAAAKQEGKTTFLYNFIKNNMYEHDIELFNSETGVEQMKDRFTDLGVPLDAPFKVYERYDHFADVIDPNKISLIDYLDLNSEFYLAGAEIDALFRKTNSLVVIAMQIPPPSATFVKGVKHVIDRDYAYGGGTTAKRAFIYVSMSSRRLKLKHAKKPAQKNVTPDNMMWEYGFDDKGQFANIKRFYGDTEPLL